MRKLLIPDILLDSVHDIDIELLKKRNIKNIIIDIDNTLVSWDTKNPDEKVNALIDKICQNGFKVCILSNSTKKRVDEFNKDFKLPAIGKAMKPRRVSFLKALKLMDGEAKDTAMIGDQIFTDIFGGNRHGMLTILVTPISAKEFIWTKFVRQIEKKILKDIKK